MKSFEQHFAENLSGFGWSFQPSDIPDSGAVGGQLLYLRDWSNQLDDFTRDVLRTVDLGDALLHAYGFANWPGQFELHAGHTFDDFAAILDNVFDCWERARNAVEENSEPAAAM